MAQKTDAELQVQLLEILNETEIRANTKTRIAAMFENMKDSKINNLLLASRQIASYILALANAGKIVEMNAAEANNLSVPPNADVAFPIGTQVLITQYGVGQTSIVAGVGVTILSASGKLKLTGQYSAATLVKIAENEWYLFGDITA